MPKRAKAYIAVVTALGGLALLDGLLHWQCRNPLRFLIYAAVAVLGSGLKVSLPGVFSTISANFLFILVGIVDLSLAETLLLGCGSVIVQCLWKPKTHTRPVQVGFNLSSLALTITGAYRLYHAAWLRPLHIELPLLLILVACAYFAMNTVPVAVAIALTEAKQMRHVWMECCFWSFPYYLVGAAVVALFNTATRFLGWQTSLLVLPVVYVIYRSYRLYLDRLAAEKTRAEDQREHAEHTAALHLRTIEALALAIEAKDHTTHDHLKRVQIYAVEIGKELHLDELGLSALRAAALLHDIGKLAVPEHIISKPGKLTPEEFEKMKIHPVVGAEILERVQFPYPVAPIVAAHHEKWDGNGYPNGIKGEQIPIGARILSAVDCLDALTSDRQYRRAIPIDEAIQVVIGEAGKAFDPQVVEILKRRYVELERVVRSTEPEGTRLSVNAKIERGLAPAAGYEQAAEPSKTKSGGESIEFLSSIAAARYEVQVLFELTHDLGNSLSLDETLSVLAMRLKKAVPYDAMAIYVPSGEKLTAAYVTGEDSRLFSSLEIPIGQGLSGWVAENKKPIVNGNPSVEPGHLNNPTKFSTLRSALSIPLEGLSGLVGVLTLYQAGKDAFTRDHLRILLAISSKLALAVENSLKFRQVEDSATIDYLTRLPNARSLFIYLEQEVARCFASGTPLTVLVGDLDGFKQVNDVFGHLEGNRLLQAVAAELKKACRDSDYIARMGGDEFVMVLPGTAEAQAQQMIERFRNAVAQAGRAQFANDMLSLSVGYANLPQDGRKAEELLAKADWRMYKVKHEHKCEEAEAGAVAPSAAAGVLVQ